MLLKSMPLRTKSTLIAASVSLALIGYRGWEFYHMTANSHLPIWAAALLTLPVICPLALIWLIWSVAVRRQEVLAVGCAAPVFIIEPQGRTGQFLILSYHCPCRRHPSPRYSNCLWLSKGGSVHLPSSYSVESSPILSIP